MHRPTQRLHKTNTNPSHHRRLNHQRLIHKQHGIQLLQHRNSLKIRSSNPKSPIRINKYLLGLAYSSLVSPRSILIRCRPSINSLHDSNHEHPLANRFLKKNVSSNDYPSLTTSSNLKLALRMDRRTSRIPNGLQTRSIRNKSALRNSNSPANGFAKPSCPHLYSRLRRRFIFRIKNQATRCVRSVND